MSMFSNNKTRLRNVHPPLIYNLKSRVPSAPWKLHLWLNNDYNLPSDKVYMCVYIFMCIISKSKPCTSSGCHLLALGADPSSPECSLAGIHLLLLKGSLIALGFFPFGIGSLSCNFSCYLPRGKWSIWYTQGIPHLLQVTSAWELAAPRGNGFSQVSTMPPGRRDLLLPFLSSESNSQTLEEPPPLSCSTALKLGEILIIEQVLTWFNKARRASESSAAAAEQFRTFSPMCFSFPLLQNQGYSLLLVLCT